MKLSTMSKNEYHQKFGALTGRTSERTIEAWAQLSKLPIVEYLIVEPEKHEKVENLRASLWGGLKKLADKTDANLRIRCAVNKHEKHVVIWKEPKR